MTHYREVHGLDSMNFGVWIWEFPPHTSEGAHHHRDEGGAGVEQYLVSEGNIEVEVDGTTHQLGPGDAITIDRASMRQARNVSNESAKVILVYEREGQP